LKPPGSVPSARQPRCTQACITSQMRSRPASISAALRQCCSLRRISSAIVRPWRRVSASNSSPVVKG
jgi:hypothetical protein